MHCHICKLKISHPCNNRNIHGSNRNMNICLNCAKLLEYLVNDNINKLLGDKLFDIDRKIRDLEIRLFRYEKN